MSLNFPVSGLYHLILNPQEYSHHDSICLHQCIQSRQKSIHGNFEEFSFESSNPLFL